MQCIKVLHFYHSTGNVMFAISDQFSQATKAAFDQQLLGFMHFSQAAVDTGVGIVDVHVDAVKESIAVATVATKQLLCVKDGSEWMSLASGQSQQACERLGAYGRQIAELVGAVHDHFSTIVPGQPALTKDAAVESPVSVKKAAIPALPVNSLPKVALDGAQEGYDIPVRAGKKATAEIAVASGASVTRGQA